MLGYGDKLLSQGLFWENLNLNQEMTATWIKSDCGLLASIFSMTLEYALLNNTSSQCLWGLLFRLVPATFLRRLSFGISVEKLKCLGVCSTFSWRWFIASALLLWEDKIPDSLSQDRQTLICTATSQNPQGIGSRTPQWTPD